MSGAHLCLVICHADQGGAGDGEPLSMHHKVIPWFLRQEADGDLATKGLGGEVRMNVQVIVLWKNSVWKPETVLPGPVTALGHVCN